jgi:RimJ/RimL family protein N-acetyltransferase
MVLQIGDYHIRRFQANDAAALHEILSDPEVMRYIEPPFHRAQTELFLQGNGLVTPPRIYALADSEDRVVGQIIFHPYDEESWEIGWIIKRSYWGRGLATAVTGALMEECRKRGIARCVIECHPAQAITGHIAQKCGFTPLDRQGRQWICEGKE